MAVLSASPARVLDGSCQIMWSLEPVKPPLNRLPVIWQWSSVQKILLSTQSLPALSRRMPSSTSIRLRDTGLIQKAIAATPAGRLVTPEDVAQVVGFLCTPAATMIRGQVIVVDGGYTLPAN